MPIAAQSGFVISRFNNKHLVRNNNNNLEKTRDMKKTLLTLAVLTGLSAGLYAQGVYLNNSDNLGATDPTLTSGGVIFVDNTFNDGPTFPHAVLDTTDVNLTLLGGSSAGSLTPVVTLTVGGGGADGDIPAGGWLLDPSASVYTIPGVANNAVGYFQLQMWIGNDASYAAASTDPLALIAQSVVFQNPTAGGGTPPIPPPNLDGMPSMVLSPIPEPSTLALAGLGAAALMFLRRRS